MPEPFADVQDAEELGSVQSCGNIFHCWERIMLSLNCMIELLGVEANPQGAILLWDDDHSADPGCWLLHWFLAV